MKTRSKRTGRTAAIALGFGFAAVPIAQAWEGPYQQLWAGLAVVFFVLAAILFVVGWWSWLKAMFCRLADWWRRFRDVPPPVVDLGEPGGVDYEAQAAAALKRLPRMLDAYAKQMGRLTKQLPRYTKRLQAASTKGAEQKQKAAKSVAWGLRQRNAKMAKYARPAHDAMLEIVEGYSGRVKWLCQQNVSEATLLQVKLELENLIEPAKDNKPIFMSYRDTIRSMRKINASRDLSVACDEQIETTNLMIVGVTRMERDLLHVVTMINKKLKL